MGNELSLSNEEMGKLVSETRFSQEEIRRMYKRFKRLDHDKNGVISMDEFKMLPALAANPLLTRLVAIFDTNHDQEVDFDEFISGISIFSSDAPSEKKLRFLFDVYDVDGDGYISNGELFHVLKTMTGTNIGDEALQQLVDRTILDTDTSGTGKVSFADFCLCLTSRKMLFENLVKRLNVTDAI
ncbi:putative calcineurin regulatory subunit B [Monocercomonoides exilis]|uniref:putative calcineurin regulatory subunit B n=1 Tax=Monocercomonoides exilis TaxID=2049356 RepID=UPI003559FBB3|nr:putative calcineurin regulatory subunit B [Monocercomonoides exilis]|eukprot:MONOS_402.1-p1 / transcript=MONOS_402.1 / gene=MONOS_402 / organism=Monocercomonoides_exilis_PA203 / gene_product=calcineurin regulatory subunit B / transcript_product=calcineurin regulatory subunit B / location=Mono_scaffold00006:249225-250195(-) / protein_length=183 / sequence_SO=supercontig / SO=protein_coding / is_pseudo=false